MFVFLSRFHTLLKLRLIRQLCSCQRMHSLVLLLICTTHFAFVWFVFQQLKEFYKICIICTMLKEKHIIFSNNTCIKANIVKIRQKQGCKAYAYINAYACTQSFVKICVNRFRLFSTEMNYLIENLFWINRIELNHSKVSTIYHRLEAAWVGVVILLISF